MIAVDVSTGDRTVCRSFVLVLSVISHTTLQPVPSPAVLRCWLALGSIVRGMALSHIASLPSNVLRRFGFELGSPDHESDSLTTTLPGRSHKFGGVVVRVGFAIKRPKFEFQATQNIRGQ